MILLSKPKGHLREIKLAFKLWFENEEGYVFGSGAYNILAKIQEKGSLSEATKSLGMSYRYAWGIIKRVEKRIGKTILKTHRGGRSGGGGCELTDEGYVLMRKYERYRDAVSNTLKNLEEHRSKTS